MWLRDTSRYANIFMRLCLPLVALPFLVTLACRQSSSQPYDERRKSMVEQQIVARGVEDRQVIAAMLKVPRHVFVPEAYRHLAYSDSPLPIGHDQTISQPYIVALMSAELTLEPGDKVLEVGTGSGYQAAVLAEIAKEVYTVEIIDALARSAESVLGVLGYTNIKVKTGDGYEGWPEYAPFDKIIVTCAPTAIPRPLVEQLREGGLMVIPVGPEGSQDLYRVKKHLGALETERIIPVRFVPLTGPHTG
jgi:protein-L-isoaspartate(D-aspartate) O-methyltransferase